MNRDELLAVLKETYPKAWFKKSEDFDDIEGGIWTGEGAYLIETYGPDEIFEKETEFEVPIFEYYPEPFADALYVDGVYKPFAKFLAIKGWVCEFYDAGTVMIWGD